MREFRLECVLEWNMDLSSDSIPTPPYSFTAHAHHRQSYPSRRRSDRNVVESARRRRAVWLIGAGAAAIIVLASLAYTSPWAKAASFGTTDYWSGKTR